jgi:hypothetical protein
MRKCKYCKQDYDPSAPECIECVLIENAKKDKKEKAMLNINRDIEIRGQSAEENQALKADIPIFLKDYSCR